MTDYCDEGEGKTRERQIWFCWHEFWRVEEECEGSEKCTFCLSTVFLTLLSSAGERNNMSAAALFERRLWDVRG